MGVDNNSPLIHRVALYEDFIREINGFKNMRYLKNHPELVTNSAKQWTLVVYNLISDTEREVIVTAKDSSSSTIEEKLGVKFNAEEHECSIRKIMRVINGKYFIEQKLIFV
jgi:hypothetical protein